MSDASFDFDVIVIGAGYGGFDAAKHAAEHGLKTAIVESRDMGGTCVNRGCVPSKALLAASGKVRELADDKHLSSFGIHAAPVRFERQKIADHANQLVQTIRTNVTKTLERAGVTILRGHGRLEGSQKVGLREPSGVDRVLTAKDVIIATGSDPFVPPGIETDGRTVFTSDEAINLEWLPRWIAIIGSGYIGLEFADVYTALGCEVTMIEAMDKVMPTFDPDIAKIAGRHLIDGRDIDARSGLLARKVTPGCPVQIELADFNSRELVETLEVDAVLVATGRVPSSKGLNLESLNVETNRGFVPIDDAMRVLVNGQPVPHLWARRRRDRQADAGPHGCCPRHRCGGQHPWPCARDRLPQHSGSHLHPSRDQLCWPDRGGCQSFGGEGWLPAWFRSQLLQGQFQSSG